MFNQIEELILKLRRIYNCHICQKISFETEYIEVLGEKKQLIEFNQNIKLTMWEFVDRTKFEEYKLVIEIEYSSADSDEVLNEIFNRLVEIANIYGVN